MIRFFIFLSTWLFIQSAAYGNCTLSIEIRDNIGPATYDYLQRAQTKAMEAGCSSILARINTPGGSLQSTRKIVELMMNSEIPYLCLIHPSGGHAGSAGAIIMQACHVNGAMEATNIGAATPISSTGEEMPEDLKKKLFEDTKSWVESLARFHGRSEKFAMDIVLDAKALSAQEAFKAKAIDQVVTDIQSFLEFAEGRKVRMTGDKTLDVPVGDILLYEPDLRHDIFQIFSNPQWAYLIFMGSIGLLYFEMTHPGVLLPGVVGAIGLVISLMNFHMLEASWGGIVLILLGMVFLFSELFIPSFGALGLGGLASFIIGSLFLFDEKTGHQIPMTLLVSTSLLLFLMMAGVTYLAVSARRRGLENREKEKLEGARVRVRHFDSTKMEGQAHFNGEWWKVESNQVFEEDEEAIVVQVKGLSLIIEKQKKG